MVLSHALMHAAAILIASFLLRGTEHQQTVSFLIIALWFSTSVMLTQPERVVCEIRWFAKLLGLRRSHDHDDAR